MMRQVTFSGPSIMLHTICAIKRVRLLIAHLLLWTTASIATMIAATTKLDSQEPGAPGVLDLTAPVPHNEQGYYHGIPGSSGGGGAWRPGPGDTMPYRLPLSLEILRATPNKDGNFVVEILVRNTDSAAFNVPASPNLTTTEKPGNKSRRVFFLQLQPLAGSNPGIVALGSATTAASINLPGSFIRLGPGKSLKILLLASSDFIRRSFSQESQKLEVKATCQEWKLDDNRFFLSGMSGELASLNTIQFALHGEQVAPVQP
jgi:hypothetical protein